MYLIKTNVSVIIISIKHFLINNINMKISINHYYLKIYVQLTFGWTFITGNVLSIFDDVAWSCPLGVAFAVTWWRWVRRTYRARSTILEIKIVINNSRFLKLKVFESLAIYYLDFNPPQTSSRIRVDFNRGSKSIPCRPISQRLV